MRKEDHLAMQVATYLNTQYPKVIYHFDTGSGGVQSIGMAMRNKKLNKWRGYPDLFICKSIGGWNGLFIELKASSIQKKNGDFLKNKHVEEQLAIQSKLSGEGYLCGFGIGFDSCKKAIDDYLNDGKDPFKHYDKLGHEIK